MEIDREKTVGIIKAGLWLLTTFWFAYLSSVVLWNIDKTSWMILLRFNQYGEAMVEIPIFIIATVWILFAGTKQIKNITEQQLRTYS
ncbi:MAG: hypothetical protein ACLFSM_00820 [Thermoplasmata archaeon]